MVVVYRPDELHFVLRQWQTGMLDQYVDRGCPKVGLKGVVATARGMRGQTLVERFTSAEVSRALQKLFKTEPAVAAAVVLIHALDQPIESLAAALGVNCSEAGYRLMLAEDRLVEVLYECEG